MSDFGLIVIVDVDGVFSDVFGRQYYFHGAERDWKVFFEVLVDDLSIFEGIRLVEGLCDGWIIVLLTVCLARLADITVVWMERYDVAWDILVMRSDNAGHISSPDVKQALFVDFRTDGYEPVLAVDDDFCNLVMYCSEGILTVYLHFGYYD